MHKTTLANLQQQSQRSNTRQERRNNRLYNKPQFIKQIEGYIRILHNQKHNTHKEAEFIFEDKIKYFNRLCEEVEDLKKELKIVIIKLNELEQANNADSIKKLIGDIEVFRNNFKLADTQYKTVLKERDLNETDFLSQIEPYQNRIVSLES
ncbi:hypothetical protein F8M41_008335 [Gigaspora margarita]|uniref:Uncharacterized protein n=1 Tax=Gigaspora margarita TaxID=4874 RepID=A0A8H3X6M6_GIGMA|nr:hypothetical protein F8M41_008335 [Gigaspora margarita]